MNARGTYRTSLIVLAVLVVGLWGGIAAAGWEPRLGLDLQGGISVVLTAEAGTDPGAIDKAVDIIRNRVDALGVAEPDISRQGENILVQLPGIKEQAKAIQLIGTTAQLQFRPVLEQLPPTPEPSATPTATPAATPTPDTPSLKCGDTDTYPPDDPAKEANFCERQRDPVTRKLTPPDTWPKLQLGPAALVGTDVAGASAQLPSGVGGGSWFIDLSLTTDGARKFAEITGQLACAPSGDPKRRLAIVLDRVVESSPQMGDEVECNRGITGGSAQITGTFSEQEAKDLALVLRYGALPVSFEPSTTTTVSPTLGRESLRGGMIAAIIGLAIVFVYVLLFYRFLGFVVWLGISLHGAITLGVVILLGETAGFALTLAGIAGLIVSLGIAADSFIVYFERLKDEVHQGRSVRASVDKAWGSAWRTIVAADLVTALAAFVLYLLAVGSVRGFALMLGLSTALDLIVSYLFMHPVVWILAQKKFFNESKTLGIRRVVGEAPAVSGGAR